MSAKVPGSEAIQVMVLGLRGFPDVQGGVESHSQELYPRLAELGFDIHVLCRSPYMDSRMQQWKGVKFHTLWSPSTQGLEAMLHSVLGVFYAALKRPDILHIHAIGPAIVTPLARLMGLKVVVTHHGPDYDREKWNAFARFVLKAGEYLGMRFSSQRIVISNVIKSLVQEKYAKGSQLIPNGVAAPIGGNDTGILQKYGLRAKNYVLLVSRMVPEKRHSDLIAAFRCASLKGWKLVLVGDISVEGEYVRGVIREAGDGGDVVLTGFQRGEALAALFRHAGIFVLPSSHEGLPIALLEAMSYGLPVVASDIPAHLELQLDQRCYFRLGNRQELAERLEDLIADQGFLLDQSIRATELVRTKYDWKDVAENTAAVYREMLGRA